MKLRCKVNGLYYNPNKINAELCNPYSRIYGLKMSDFEECENELNNASPKLPVKHIVLKGSVSDCFLGKTTLEYEIRESSVENDLGLDANKKPCIFINGKWIF